MLKKYAKLGVLILYYGVAAWFALGLMGYGLAWRNYPKTHTVNLNSGGGVYAGDIESIDSSGFFGRRDYFIQLHGRTERILIPFTLLNPPWKEDEGPRIDLSKLVKSGDHVYIRTTGGPSIVLELINRPEGKPQIEVMNYSRSQVRFVETLARAKSIGDRYILLGALLFGAAGLAHAALARRALRPAKPSRA